MRLCSFVPFLRLHYVFLNINSETMSSIPRTVCVCCKTVRRYSGTTVKEIPQGEANVKKVKKQSRKILKRYQSENKKLFGDLLETAAQRNKREISEPSKTERTVPSGLSEEIWWWPKAATKSFKVDKEIGNPIISKATFNTQNELEISLSDSKTLKRGCYQSNGVPECEKNEGLKHLITELPNPSKKLSKIIVRNLESFPLANNSKNCLDKFICNSNILSIPLIHSNDVKDNSQTIYPSVSKILNTTMSDSSRAALERWKDKMVKELGEDGFLIYQKGLLNDGKLFHCAIQSFLSGTPENNLVVDPAIEGCWHSLKSILPNVCDVKALESHVIHKELIYHGIIDCVASFKGKPLLIEWKKSNKQKTALRSTFDAPLQVAAYLGALNFDLNYNFKVSGGMVVVAYTDGSPAHVHLMSWSECLKYWQMWLERLKLFWNGNDQVERREISASSTKI